MARYCDRCHRGSWACTCDLSFKDRVGTIQVSTSGFETRNRPYYDPVALDEQFGTDRRERYLEQTHGYGALKHKDGQSYYKHHRTGEVKPLPDAEVDRVYLS